MTTTFPTNPLQLLALTVFLLHLLTPSFAQTAQTIPPNPQYSFLYPARNGNTNLTVGANDTIEISWQQWIKRNSSTTVQIQCWTRNASTLDLDATGTYRLAFLLIKSH